MREIVILNSESIKPLYIQIAEWLEAEILRGNLTEDERIYSQYQLAEIFTINPATAAKGLNLLADEGIVYKKRGLGMFVSPRAKSYILNKRKNQVLEQTVRELVDEAMRLGVKKVELMNMINKAYEKIDELEKKEKRDEIDKIESRASGEDQAFKIVEEEKE